MDDPKTYTEEEFLDLQNKSEETKKKLDEFRTNNVKLLKDMETLSAKFDGIDLDNYNDMLKLQQDQKDKTLIDAGKIDELLEERTKAMIKTHGVDMEKLTSENSVLHSQLAGLVIDSAVRDSATKAGVVDTAIDDILLRSKAVFTLKDGQAIPHDATGSIIYGSSSAEPMTVEEWVKGQQDVAPHLFKSSQGGGSEHGKSFVGAGSKDMTALEKLQYGFAKK
jgi:hypothetical protein